MGWGLVYFDITPEDDLRVARVGIQQGLNSCPGLCIFKSVRVDPGMQQHGAALALDYPAHFFTA
jgi:hypothetical protein